MSDKTHLRLAKIGLAIQAIACTGLVALLAYTVHLRGSVNYVTTTFVWASLFLVQNIVSLISGVRLVDYSSRTRE